MKLLPARRPHTNHSMVPNVDCTIVIGDEATLRAWGRTRNLFMHEIGHCNGWGHDHAGAR